MLCRSFSSLSDHALLRELGVLVAQDRSTTASLLACLAETDRRKLYVPMGHGSLYMYCVRVLRMSEDIAFKRIRAARAARRFPAILPALADGRLTLNAVVLISGYLQRENADELLAAVTHKTRAEIERLIAERFPQPDVPTTIRAITVTVDPGERVAQPCEPFELGQNATAVVPSNDASQPNSIEPLAARPVVPSIPAGNAATMEPLPTPIVTSSAMHPKIAPLSPGRYELRVTVSEHAHEQLRYAQALLGHVLPSGDISQVLERALEALVEKLEKHKFAKRSRSSSRRQSDASESSSTRDIPAHMRRQVWQRDQGQCTFVGPDHDRCEARSQLEFDHVEPLARGGQTCVSNLRLLCRAHNQHAARLAYGAAFMAGKRERARLARARTQVQSLTASRSPSASEQAAPSSATESAFAHTSSAAP